MIPCPNCDALVDREGDHMQMTGGLNQTPATLRWTCTARDWRGEAMRLREKVKRLRPEYVGGMERRVITATPTAAMWNLKLQCGHELRTTGVIAPGTVYCRECAARADEEGNDK